MQKTFIGVLINNDKLLDSVGNNVDTNSLKEVLDFLLKDWNRPNALKATWNIYTLVDLIGHLLTKKDYETLLSTDKVEVTVDGHVYRIFSSSGRMFSITHKVSTHFKDNPEVNIYHLSQFFPNDNVNTIEELTNKGNELLKALDEMGFNPVKLSSAVAIYDEKLKTQKIPTIYDLSDEGMDFCDFAYKLMGREWRTVYEIGHWDKATDYDLRSAYPACIKDFRDTSKCKFWKSKTLQKSDFGILKGTIDITSDFSPIVNEYGENIKGKYPDYFTTGQIGFLYHYGLGTFELEEGRYLKFLSDDKPFEKMMLDLYHSRELGGVKKTFAKSVSVGIGGRFSQEHKEKFGSYYNPIYSVMTTSGVSLAVGKFIMNNNLVPNLISIMVDGVLADKDIPIEDNKVIGDWRKEEVNALVLSLGNQYVKDTSGTSKKDVHLNTYDTMMKSIKDHPNKNIYNGVLLVKEMLETKRTFSDYPKTGKDLLNNIYTSTANQFKSN